MKYILIFIKSSLMILLISSVALAAPTIGGYFSETEWTIDGTEYFTGGDGIRGDDGSSIYNYGGQNFDVEYISLFIDDTNLYFGLQTGFELNYKEYASGRYLYPGDIALGFNPVGTDPQQRDYQFGFKFTIPEIQGENYGQSGVQYVAELETYFQPNWSDPTIFDDAGPYNVSSGTTMNPGYEAKYKRFGGTSGNPDRNTLEASVSLAAIAGKLSEIGINPSSSDVTIHWTMQCGNDYLDHTIAFNAPVPIPEPATFLLFATGLFGLGAVKRKNFQVFEKGL